MESVNVMAKISHGCGSVGSIRSQRRRIVSEPTDSLVFTCDDNTSMKLGNFSPNKLLIRNDLQHAEAQQQQQQQLHQVRNSLIPSSPESLLVSKEKNDVDGTIQMVSESSDLFGGEPLHIDESNQQRRLSSHHIIHRPQPHHMVKSLERKEMTTNSTTGYFTKGLLQVVNSEQVQKQQPVQQPTYSESDRLFTRPERLRQHVGYKNTSNNNSNGSNNTGNVGNKTTSPTPNNQRGSQIGEDEHQLMSQNNPDVHECGQCKKAFCSKVQLGRHIKIHSCEKAFLCSQCEQTFHRKDHLKTHEKTHQQVLGGNMDKAFYECERVECGKTYNSYSSYMKHRKTHEIADSSLTGEGMLVGMKQGATLSPAPHQRTLSVGSGMQLKAAAEHNTMTTTTTSLAGSTAANNTPSRRSHREQGEKRFQCMQCSKKFPTSKDLKRHDVVHTGNREFQCSFCSHRFGRKDHRMRHEKKTHALELSNQQQQNLNNTSSAGATSGSTTVSTNNVGCTNQTCTQNNSSANNIISSNIQSTSLIESKGTCSSPSSTSSSVSPPALIPITVSSSPSTNSTFSIQTNSCVSPNLLPHSSPTHQFQVHDQFQPKVNILALSPPSPANMSSPCQILETSPIPSNHITNIADPTFQHFGMIDVKHLQINRRWRHVSSPSTLQQVHPSPSNIHVLNANTIPSSLRGNTALFPNIIVVENSSGNGISCAGSGNRVLIRKADAPDDPLDINTLLAQQPCIRNNPRDAMMVSPKPEPPDSDDFFEICGENNISDNVALENVRAMTQEQPHPGEMILSQIKEEKDDKNLQEEEGFVMDNALMISNQQQHHPLVTRIQPSASTNESSILLQQIPLGQERNLIKNEFILKKEDAEEPMDEMMDDHPNGLSTQLQESVRLKSEDDSNGDIDWLLTEMMTDSQIVTTTSNIIIPQQVSINSSPLSASNKPSPDTSSSMKSNPVGTMTSYLSSSVPVGNTVVFGAPRVTPGIPCTTSVKNAIGVAQQQHIAVSQFSQPKVGSLDTSTLMYEDHKGGSLGVNVFGQRSNYSLNTQKKLLGDLFTGTKNPVLPSIYTDSTLIVPEPRASKYHSPHQSLQMFESDFMDIDSFLKGGSDVASTPGDGKDVPESIFNM